MEGEEPKYKVSSKPSSEFPSKTESYKYSAVSYRQLSYEKELFELVQLSDVPLDYELFKVIFELLKENVAPNAIVQVLKALRSASEGHSPTSSSSRVQSRMDSHVLQFDLTHQTKTHSSTDSSSTMSLDSNSV